MVKVASQITREKMGYSMDCVEITGEPSGTKLSQSLSHTIYQDKFQMDRSKNVKN